MVEIFEIQTLIEAAVSYLDVDESALPQGAVPAWTAIHHLQGEARRETLEACTILCRSPNPTERRVGAAVLGQLGCALPAGKLAFPKEQFQVLNALLICETIGPAVVEVLADVCFALGHINDPRAIEQIVLLRNHPNVDVRMGVVHGLSKHENETAIAALIALSKDCHDGIRDWATFGLATLIDVDTPAVRAALHARVGDSDANVRSEAISGLARRRDLRVLPALIQELNEGGSAPLFEAAIALADPSLCDAIAASRQTGLKWLEDGIGIDLAGYWEEATQACQCRDQN